MDGAPERNLDDAIWQAERVLADLRRQRTVRDARRFVTALARVVPDGVVFSARELLDHAHVDPDLRAVLDGVTAKQLGKYLHRVAAHGPTESGLALRRITRNGDGCIWAVTLTR